MYQRLAIGIGTLLLATSCVAPVGTSSVAPRRQVAVARAPVRPVRTVIPAGPPPQLLAALSDTDLTGALAGATPPPFVAALQPEDAARALDCLTAAVYYEARSEPLDGQEAVAQVVLNRVRNPAFPNSVCGTVYEGSSRETGCQFSFTCDGSMLARREPAAWARARLVAAAALAGNVYTPVGSATYYHTTAVSPWWASKLTRIGQIGAHIFYRLGGAWGGALAFDQRYGGIEPAPAIGMRYPEKPMAEIFEAVEAGVTIHRGGEPTAANATTPDATVSDAVVTRPVSESAGVRIHRAGDALRSTVPGVVVHVSRPEDPPAPTDT